MCITLICYIGGFVLVSLLPLSTVGWYHSNESTQMSYSGSRPLEKNSLPAIVHSRKITFGQSSIRENSLRAIVHSGKQHWDKCLGTVNWNWLLIHLDKCKFSFSFLVQVLKTLLSLLILQRLQQHSIAEHRFTLHRTFMLVRHWIQTFRIKLIDTLGIECQSTAARKPICVAVIFFYSSFIWFVPISTIVE